ncbi:helix-turn-helix domain-containing protein [Fibrella aquatica]|uniref:helix-turn-helix domain-containing protein n=1 Tax=Fibrella aquatica TaxID=3242487 RepID=UPI00352084F0
MNTIGSRVKMVVDHFNLSNLGFSQRIGVSSTVINGIVKDEHKPGNKVLDAIKKEYPQISTDWILSGTGDMLIDNSRTPSFGEDILARVSLEVAQLREVFANQLSAKDQQIASLQRMLEATLLGKPNDVTQDRSSIRRMFPFTNPQFTRVEVLEEVA